MAHSALHFSLGMLIGSAIALPAVARAWRAGGAMARGIGRWLLISYALGVFAIVPSLLRWCGVPAHVTGSRWMNLFLLHPLLTRCRPGGTIPAGVAIVLCFAAPYGLLLAAIWRATRRTSRPPPPGE